MDIAMFWAEGLPMDGAMEVAGAIWGLRDTVDRETAVNPDCAKDTCTPPTDPTTAGPGWATATCCVGGANDWGGACWGAWGGGGGRGGPVGRATTDPSDVIGRGWDSWAAVRGCTLVATGMVDAKLTAGTVTAVTLPPALLRRNVVTCELKRTHCFTMDKTMV